MASHFETKYYTLQSFTELGDKNIENSSVDSLSQMLEEQKNEIQRYKSKIEQQEASAKVKKLLYKN